MSQEEIIAKVREAIEEDPNKDYIKSISLFGSFLRGDFTEKSDIDLMYETYKTMSLFQSGGLQYRLQEKLGKKVDFVPKNSLIHQLRDKIISEAKVIYERK